MLAAELGRQSAGAMLLECGAKVYAIDFTGMYGISAMVDKCPPLALKVIYFASKFCGQHLMDC